MASAGARLVPLEAPRDPAGCQIAASLASVGVRELRQTVAPPQHHGAVAAALVSWPVSLLRSWAHRSTVLSWESCKTGGRTELSRHYSSSVCGNTGTESASLTAGSSPGSGGGERPCQRRIRLVDYRVVDDVTPHEIAKSLGVTGLQFRTWLRAQKALGHPLLARHEYRTRYRFTRAEAAELTVQYRSGTTTRAPAVHAASTSQGTRPVAASLQDPFAGLTFSEDPGHRVTETWMGRRVETLADLLRPGVKAARCRDQSIAGLGRRRPLLPGATWPTVLQTPRGGRRDSKVLFTFKASAEALLGPLDGPGIQTGRTIVNAQLFVMPGPMANTDAVQRTLRDLRAWWNE